MPPETESIVERNPDLTLARVIESKVQTVVNFRVFMREVDGGRHCR